MNSLDFVKKLRSFVIDFNLNEYKKLLEELKSSDRKEEQWSPTLKFYNNLDAESQKVFFSIVREIKVDTTSLILGILDGRMILDNQEEDFFLSLQGSNKPINGELQERFLELEEGAD